MDVIFVSIEAVIILIIVLVIIVMHFLVILLDLGALQILWIIGTLSV